MNVILTPEQEQLIREKLETGRYVSAGEIVSEALRLLEERDHIRQVQRAELQRQIAIGVEQLDRGEVIPAEHVFEELRNRIRPLAEPAP
jgi:antitoxin ParD1/3/4